MNEESSTKNVLKANAKTLEYGNLLEEDLLRLVVDMDDAAAARAATEEILRRSYGWIRRVCLYTARDPEESQDCLQEALVEIARSLSRFRRDSSLRTWMFVIVRRVAFRRRRKGLFLLQKYPLGLERDVAAEAEKSGVETTVGRRVDVELELAEEHRRLWKQVHCLPEKQKMAIILHYAEDLSVAEIAESLECSASAVKTHLMRGREKLRERLREAGVGKL